MAAKRSSIKGSNSVSVKMYGQSFWMPISGSFVIARNTAFTYKGKTPDVRQIGRELNVRYVLEGSVQRAGNRLRVNVPFIDAQTGSHNWAERFDKPMPVCSICRTKSYRDLPMH